MITKLILISIFANYLVNFFGKAEHEHREARAEEAQKKIASVRVDGADGSIVPIASYKGVRFSTQQINDYVAGKAIRVDGCQGATLTVWIKFNPQRMTPGVYSSNPDLAGQAVSQSQSYGPCLSRRNHTTARRVH